jgi:putative heme-binding domain-containing protein
MRYMHEPAAVEGLIKKLSAVRAQDLRRGILVTLIRLYYREADYVGSWWGIRPDNTGPYYDRADWEMTSRIGAVITAAVLDADAETAAYLKAELLRHRVALSGIPLEASVAAAEKDNPISIPQVDKSNPNHIGNLSYDVVAQRTLAETGDAKRGEALFKSQSCAACHTTADGQTPKGPHLVDIGKRYKSAELVESIMKPGVKLAQGFESYQFETVDGRVFTGFVVSERSDATVFRESNGVQRELKRDQIESRQQQKQSAMPEGLVANLTPDKLADLVAYLQSLK